MESKLTKKSLEAALYQLGWAHDHMCNLCDCLQKASMCIPSKSSWWQNIYNLVYDLAIFEEKLNKTRNNIEETIKRMQAHG